MHERDIFDEKQEIKTANYSCPNCRERSDYEVRWMKRTKKKNAPRNLNQNDLARQLSVSRPILREALQGLETIGIIEIRAGDSLARELAR